MKMNSIIGACLAALLLSLSFSGYASNATGNSPTLLASGGFYGGGTFYVCYTSRHASQTASGRHFIRYRGCYIKHSPCRNHYHFGRYKGHGATNRALARCHNSTPRFVD